MPEIKHTFISGKMNKDLDDRLVPNGEYRDAMNVQVSTSEESDVGTAQNILGNTEVVIDGVVLPDHATTVASISDEKNDKLYYFVWTLDADYIFEHSRLDNNPTPIFVDINKNVLKFDPINIITGINIIDDMLFWTDNINEPRKINITRSKQGTTSLAAQTKLINDSQSLTNIDIEEKHITVIKKAPKKPLDMRVSVDRNPNKIYTGVLTITTEDNKANSSFFGGLYDFSGIEVGTDRDVTLNETGDTLSLSVVEGLSQSTADIQSIGDVNNSDGLTGWHTGPTNPTGNNNAIAVGTKFAISPFDDDNTPPGLPLTDYVLKGIVVDYDPDTDANTFDSGFTIKILSQVGIPPIPADGNNEIKYVIDLWDEEEKLFEFKFPRFSYRYKFEDGEYSPFAPFTQVAFRPGAFDYHPKKGYNLGMTNRAKEIELTRIVTPQTPKDVTSIDILFKDDASPVIYVVDTISQDDYEDTPGTNSWKSNRGDWVSGVASNPYIISKETVRTVVPSNQLLRPYDNVPRRALAQDVTGNRIVYGNYIQNYTLISLDGKKYTPNISVYWSNNPSKEYYDNGLDNVLVDPNITETLKSVKSLREYQLGVVFTDEYGRETPVISNTSGAIKLEKERADKYNRFQVQLLQALSRPQNATHMKFYIKETAGEYYNMAMDRFYDAEDGNIWLAFPSSDRNKIDIDTFIILKKGSDQDTLVTDVARYKVLAVENEAPDFIKTNKLLSVSATHSSVAVNLFSAGQLPLIGRDEFKMDYSPFAGGPGRNLDIVTDAQLYVEFQSGLQTSERYRITSITQNSTDSSVGVANAQFSIQLEKPLGSDVNFISNDPSGANSSSINNGTTINIYKYRVENTPKFDGRFFVKIFLDEVFTENIGKSFLDGLDFRVISSSIIYSMNNRDEHIEKHWSGTNVNYPLTDGHPGIEANDFNAGSQAFNYANTDIDRAYGYYGIAEFASMSTYFRRLKTTNFGEDGLPTSRNTKPGVVSPGYNSSVTQVTTIADSKLILPLTKVNASTTTSKEYKNEFWDWDDKAYGESVNYTGHWLDQGNIYEELPHQIGADNPIETDVWFIDAGPAAARRNSTDDDLAWQYLNPFPLNDGAFPSSPFLTGSGASPTRTGYQDNLTESGGYENQGGLTVSSSGKWSMTISYGGIYGAEYENDTSDFFNFGNWFTPNGKKQNPYYTSSANSKNTTFTQNFKPGAQFRFREDPNQTIYTIPDLSRLNLLRHSSRRSKTVANNPSSLGLVNVGGGVSMAEDLSHNFTSGFNIKNIPETLAWNPVTDGQINNGTEITLTIADSTGGTTSGTSGITSGGGSLGVPLVIYVSTLKDNTSTSVLIPGMALKEYNGNVLKDSANLGSSSNEFLVVTQINELASGNGFELTLGGYRFPLSSVEHALADTSGGKEPTAGGDYKFVQVGMNGYSHNSEFNFNTRDDVGAIGAVGFHLDFIEPIEPEEILSDNPAIWETEPKETKDLDIYYEASAAVPLFITEDNIHEAVPLGSKIIDGDNGFIVVDYRGDELVIAAQDPSLLSAFFSSVTSGKSKEVTIMRPDDLDFRAIIPANSVVFGSAGSPPKDHAFVRLDNNMYNNSYELPWYNCYSFGNGVESNRIRDNFNLPFISNGVRVSTTLETEYKEEHRKYGLIYSGLYNSTGGVNNLNQFIAAEKITKDINPIYGSIQKLYSRDSDLVTLCEDKVLKILANKDAVFNADGNTNLTATENVLGQTIPFAGEYGISTNPESFASENYRAYFSDKVRGAILRLSMDGLTPISEAGMKDWFRDNLKISNRVIGSYDDRNSEYNVKLEKIQAVNITYPDGDVNNPEYSTGFFLNQKNTAYNFYQILGGLGLIATPYDDMALIDKSAVLTFKERTKGWVSFKSFSEMQFGISMANDYYTFDKGRLYKHHDENGPRNTFYNNFTSSTIDVILNDAPSDTKVFHTLNYEGSASKVDKFESQDLTLPYQDTRTYNDQEVYNLDNKDGWFVKRIITNKEEGYINEFLEKEGRWFNNIKKCVNPLVVNSDTADFSFQGIGFIPVGGVDYEANPTATPDTWDTTKLDPSCFPDEDNLVNFPSLIIDPSISVSSIPTSLTAVSGVVPTSTSLEQQLIDSGVILAPTPVVLTQLTKPTVVSFAQVAPTILLAPPPPPLPPGGVPTTLAPVAQTPLLAPLTSTAPATPTVPTVTATNNPYAGTNAWAGASFIPTSASIFPPGFFSNFTPSYKGAQPTSLVGFQSSPSNYRAIPPVTEPVDTSSNFADAVIAPQIQQQQAIAQQQAQEIQQQQAVVQASQIQQQQVNIRTVEEAEQRFEVEQKKREELIAKQEAEKKQEEEIERVVPTVRRETEEEIQIRLRQQSARVSRGSGY